jgi:glutathione S-transferase
MTSVPVLYSFRRCPYAIRARMALRVAEITVTLREVDLGKKPDAMLSSSPKGSVPILVLPDDTVIDESLDIMKWALGKNDPLAWLKTESPGVEELIAANDDDFKHHLDRYKYPQWHAGASKEAHRAQAEKFLLRLEQRLTQHAFLDSDRASILDAAIGPFVRQFAAVDEAWFKTSPYPALQVWLTRFLESERFLEVMGKQPVWKHDDSPVFFP